METKISELKKAQTNNEIESVVTLASGVKVMRHPVSAALVQDGLLSLGPMPVPPRKENPDRGDKYDDVNDPEYLRQIQARSDKQTSTMIDIMVIFGLELIDGLPEDDSWLRKLKLLEKKEYVDLNEYDLENDDELQFLYLRYVVATTDEIATLTMLSGISAEEIAKQQKSFRGQTQ